MKCKICYYSRYKEILNLALTRTFLAKNQKIKSFNINLVQCDEGGLVQLKNICETNYLYGDFYGYASSLNQSIIEYLKGLFLSVKETF
jgi:hypothetical protein